MDQQKKQPKPEKLPTPINDSPLDSEYEHDRDLLAEQVESSRLYE